MLRLGIASALVLAVVGGAVVLVRPGLREGRLADAGREVFSSVGRAILAGILPLDAGATQIALNGMLDRIDALTLALPPHVQAELSQLLGLLATSAGRIALAGLATSWPKASVPQVQEALQSMRASDLALRQQAYAALHDIVSAAYFSDAGTWSVLGYPGPTPV